MGINAFREAYLSSDAAHVTDFESIEARQMRYQIYWSMFENTAYRRVHNWTTALKHKYALYKYVRNLYNPAYRLGSFYASHLWGGRLSLEAGDDGAIPIVTENEALRPALSSLWKSSNLGTQKDIIALRGTIEGDVILRIVDDVERAQVYIERVDPRVVSQLTLDPFGNVKAYTIEEKRQNPEGRNTVEYREEVTRDGDNVVYETFLNDKPYGWNAQPAKWANPYTFIPMVLIKHMDVGLDWGWSELHSMRSKVMEIDDLASMISDQVRKSVDALWLMKGMKPKTLTVTGEQADISGDRDTRPEPGREELKALWNAPKDSDAEALVAPLKLTGALQHLDGILKELERDYPELRIDAHATSGASGRALRVARQQVSSKVRQRRENYDIGLVRANQMGIAIAGWRGYSGYEGFNLDSYARGDLAHSVGERPVFAADPMDKIELDAAMWEAAKMAVKAGADLAGFLRSQGLDDEQVQVILGGGANVD